MKMHNQMVKGKIAVCVGFLLWVIPGMACAENLRFSWEYPPEAQSTITGFRLYRDGNILEVDGIPSNARTVAVLRMADKQSHTYLLTAINLVTGEESKSSATSIDAWIAARLTPVGLLRVEVIP